MPLGAQPKVMGQHQAPGEYHMQRPHIGQHPVVHAGQEQRAHKAQQTGSPLHVDVAQVAAALVDAVGQEHRHRHRRAGYAHEQIDPVGLFQIAL